MPVLALELSRCLGLDYPEAESKMESIEQVNLRTSSLEKGHE